VTVRAPINEWTANLMSANLALAVGSTIVPGNNVYSAYSQVIVAVDDVYGLWLNISNIGVSGLAKDALAKIGVDPAGGTAFVDKIIDIACSSAGALSGTGGLGIWYYFELGIRAGSSIAVAVSTNNAVVGTSTVFIQLVGRPTGPVAPRAGSFVQAFGSSPATSSGTAITPGSAGASSAWIQLGSALTAPIWAWNLGICINNSIQNNNIGTWDLGIGDASNKRVVIADLANVTTTAETHYFKSISTRGQGNVGDGVFVRGRAAGGTALTGLSVIAHGTGG